LDSIGYLLAKEDGKRRKSAKFRNFEDFEVDLSIYLPSVVFAASGIPRGTNQGLELQVAGRRLSLIPKSAK
jgi:hypothetical protein